jgi:uncharacterized membrane protein
MNFFSFSIIHAFGAILISTHQDTFHAVRFLIEVILYAAVAWDVLIKNLLSGFVKKFLWWRVHEIVYEKFFSYPRYHVVYQRLIINNPSPGNRQL